MKVRTCILSNVIPDLTRPQSSLLIIAHGSARGERAEETISPFFHLSLRCICCMKTTGDESAFPPASQGESLRLRLSLMSVRGQANWRGRERPGPSESQTSWTKDEGKTDIEPGQEASWPDCRVCMQTMRLDLVTITVMRRVTSC